MCQAVRAPGSNETRLEATRAGACGVMIGSCQHRAGEAVGRRAAGRPRAREMDIHGVSSSCGFVAGVLIYFFVAA